MLYKLLICKMLLISIVIILCVYNMNKSRVSSSLSPQVNAYHPKKEKVSNVRGVQSNQSSMLAQSNHTTFDSSTKLERPKAILLVSQTRSGSSLVGEIFNQRAGVSYFYEPLYPFGKCPQKRPKPVVAEYFNHTLRFDFEGAYSLYKRAYSFSHQEDQAGCLTRGVCFASISKCGRFLSRDAKICRLVNARLQECPMPLNLIQVSNAVKKSSHIAFKIVYLCSFAEIKSIVDNSEFDVKIIHLVRDPRAIVNSRLKVKTRSMSKNYKRLNVKPVCTHLNDLLETVDEHFVKSGRYIRVRHEDFALEPLMWTRKIYEFVNLTFNNEILDWLKNATSSNNSNNLSKTNLFSTVRNSKDTVRHWRRELTFKEISQVQTLCKPLLQRLGYIMFNNSEEPLNYNISSFSS